MTAAVLIAAETPPAPDDGLPPGQPYVSPDDLASIPPLFQAAAEQALLPLVAQIWQESASTVHAQLVDAADLPNLPPVSSLAAETYLAQAANTFAQVGDDLWNTARNELLVGFQNGESIPQLSDRLRHSAGLTARRATLVARTQVLDASNAGSYATAQTAGIDGLRKGWLDTPDQRTRPTHRAAGAAYGSDQRMIPMADQFTVGGYSCDRPHDPSLPPAERYSCRCALIYSMGPAAVRDAQDEATPQDPLPNTSGQPELPTPVLPVEVTPAEAAAAQAAKISEAVGSPPVTRQLAHQATITPHAMADLDSVHIPGLGTPDGDAYLAAKNGASHAYYSPLGSHPSVYATSQAVTDNPLPAIWFNPHWNEARLGDVVRKGIDSGWYSPSPAALSPLERTLAHEYGHHVTNVLFEAPNFSGTADMGGAIAQRILGPINDALGANRLSPFARNGDLLEAIHWGAAGDLHFSVPGQLLDEWIRQNRDLIAAKVSGYAAKNFDEFLAEVWQEYSTMGAAARPHIQTIGALLRDVTEELRAGGVRAGRIAAELPQLAAEADALTTYRAELAELMKFRTKASVKPLRGGGRTGKAELVTYRDGTQVVRKQYAEMTPQGPGVAIADAEELAALVGRIVGADVPVVGRAGERELVQRFIAGRQANARTTIEQYANTEDGRRLGLLDALVGNGDRENNWIIGEDGRIFGIDQGGAFRANEFSGSTSPFARMFFGPLTNYGKATTWADTVPASAEEIRNIRAGLEAVRPEFARLDREDWYQQVIQRLNAIEARAGRAIRPAVAVAPDLSKQSVIQLRALAKERGIPGYSKLTKPQLVERLSGAPPAAVAEAVEVPLAARRITELRILAKQRGLTVPPRATKAQLVKALEAPPKTAAEQLVEANAAKRAAARERNKLIEARAAAEQTLAELDDLLFKKASREVFEQRIALAQLDGKDLAALRAALDDPVKLRAQVTRISKKQGITVTGRAGAKVKYDPELHDPVGEVPPLGTPMVVIRRGSTVTVEGETILLNKAVVKLPTTPVKAAKAVPKKAVTVRPAGKMSPTQFDAKARAAASGNDALSAAPRLVRFDDQSGKWIVDGVADPARAGQAVHDYWDFGQDVNRYLRDGVEAFGRKGEKLTAAQVRRTIDGLDSIFDVSQLDRPVVTWRGFGGRTVFGDDPDLWPENLTGREWVDKAYVSTAVDRAEAANFVTGGSAGVTDFRGVMARILLPRGGPVLSMGEFEAGEMLLSHGWTFRVIRDHGWVEDRRKSGTRFQRLLDLQAIPPGGAM